MDFTPDDTQQAVAELAATVLRGSGGDQARAAAALGSTAGYDEAAWKALAHAGLLALAVPADHGGDGLGALEVAAVLTEVGRQALALPALATLALGVLPIVALGTPEQQSVLGAVGDGAVLTAALRPMSVDAAGRVTGRVPGVPFAAQALRILVPTEHGVALVEPGADGVEVVLTPTSSGAPEYTLTCHEVVPDAMLAGDSGSLDRFAVAGATAVADGVVAGALALTAHHLRDRVQFGRPLAAFQAVAQEIGDIYITARTVHLTATTLNWELANDRETTDDVEIAAYWLAAELPSALQMCHHLHGGLGVDISYPLHRYYSHAKDLARLVGGAAYRLDRIGLACR